jgi:protein-S-isoprenylcysteine O-methyltransferase Ste14
VSRSAVFLLLVISQILAMLLALLGVETLPTNPLGWLLFLTGIAYLVWMGILFFNHKERFWESALGEVARHEERGDHSSIFIAVGMIAIFFSSPVEYIYLSTIMSRNAWMSSIGLGLVTLGAAMLGLAWRALRKNYSWYPSVKSGQALVQRGPYRFIRHPIYAGYLLISLGISLGYSSLAGLTSFLILLLPSMLYRMHVEEKMLTEHFGDAYRRYASMVKRLIPGVW